MTAATTLSASAPLGVRLRQRVGSAVVTSTLTGLASVGRLHPAARPLRRNVEVIRDLAYRPGGRVEHRLDVYRPTDRRPPLGAVLYVHGGGFRILSKDTHWMMGLTFAHHGYVCFNVNYRLAPRHPYPAALEDVTDALEWVLEHVREHGAGPEDLVLAGESAGANLVTSLAIACCWPRPEPFARRTFELGFVPRAVLPACGFLQASDPERFHAIGRLPTWIADRMAVISRAYLPAMPAIPGGGELADPVCFLERATTPSRPLPPFGVGVGTRDPVLDDSRRLERALARLGAAHEVRYYPGEFHAFQAFLGRPAARLFWADTFKFLAAGGASAPGKDQPERSRE